MRFIAANGPVIRPTMWVQARLLNPAGVAPVGDWFDEFACVDPDTAVIDGNGQQLRDGAGNVVYLDDRLSGPVYKRDFFCGTGPQKPG